MSVIGPPRPGRGREASAVMAQSLERQRELQNLIRSEFQYKKGWPEKGHVLLECLWTVANCRKKGGALDFYNLVFLAGLQLTCQMDMLIQIVCSK